jgi:hypothetical protein
MQGIDVMFLIDDEIRKAEAKHPKWPADRLRQAAIVVEEAGELLQATLNLVEHREKPTMWGTASDYVSNHRQGHTLDQKIVHEAAQTAAMAIRFLQNYEYQYPVDIDKDGLADARTQSELPREPEN